MIGEGRVPGQERAVDVRPDDAARDRAVGGGLAPFPVPTSRRANGTASGPRIERPRCDSKPASSREAGQRRPASPPPPRRRTSRATERTSRSPGRRAPGRRHPGRFGRRPGSRRRSRGGRRRRQRPRPASPRRRGAGQARAGPRRRPPRPGRGRRPAADRRAGASPSGRRSRAPPPGARGRGGCRRPPGAWRGPGRRRRGEGRGRPSLSRRASPRGRERPGSSPPRPRRPAGGADGRGGSGTTRTSSPATCIRSATSAARFPAATTVRPASRSNGASQRKAQSLPDPPRASMTTTRGSLPAAARSMISLQDDGFLESMRRTTRPSMERGRQRPSTSSTRAIAASARAGSTPSAAAPARAKSALETEVRPGSRRSSGRSRPGPRTRSPTTCQAGIARARPHVAQDQSSPSRRSRTRQVRQTSPSTSHHIPPATQTTSSWSRTDQATSGSSALATTVHGQASAASALLPVAGERLAPHPALQVVAAQVHQEDRPRSRGLRDRPEVGLVGLEGRVRGAAVRVEGRDQALRHVGPGRVVGDGAGRPERLGQQPARGALAVRGRDEGHLPARGEAAQGLGVELEGDAAAHRGPPPAAQAARRRGGRPAGSEGERRAQGQGAAGLGHRGTW